MELWRPIKEGYYEASNQGCIRRAVPGNGTWPGRLLKPKINPGGYLVVNCSVNGRTDTNTVHRLVAEAFLGPCPVGLQINHRNADKTDNRVDNLEYVTSKENNQHAFELGLNTQRLKMGELGRLGGAKVTDKRRGENSGKARLTCEAVRYIRKLARDGQSQSKIALLVGVSKGAVKHVLRGRTWSHVH